MKVRWSPSAARELVEILQYIRERSPAGAVKVVDRIRRAERILSDFPLHGATTRTDPAIRRVMMVPYPYVMFYEVERDQVIVRRIRHAARRPDQSQ